MTNWSNPTITDPSWGPQSLSVQVKDYLAASAGVYITDRLGNKFLLNRPSTLQGTLVFTGAVVVQLNWQ